MDIAYSAEDEAFRDEVRTFLDARLSDDMRRAAARTTTVFADKDLAMAWQAILVERGWAVPSWPVEHGGTGWTPTEKYIFGEELAKAGAPGLIPLGLRMLAPVLFKYGTPEQKAHYLPKMLSGEHYWCQGYSEPGSGSDLSSLKTAAVKDGDDYIVNGSKIWTTHAQFADHIFCLVRTDSSGRPQQGITFLLIPMATPGVSVEPII
ncbi:MAG: acyl-CoA dehydrogenase, partial [Gammaproteobacteria bacterium]|nr:acyl-CoA dehydrogenase [Gammaproteobacteria bacterium]